MKQPAVYILANKKDGTLYTGVTSSLAARITQHKEKAISGFSSKYNCMNLVYFEIYDDIKQAITREKQIKAGSRKKKVELIEKENPEWRDLYGDILQ
jgi:putative endonuclease